MTNTIIDQITLGENITDLGEDRVGDTVVVKGSVDRIRDQKYVQFINLNDGTGTIQIVCEKNEANAQLNERVSSLRPGSTKDAALSQNKAGVLEQVQHDLLSDPVNGARKGSDTILNDVCEMLDRVCLSQSSTVNVSVGGNTHG